MIAINSSWHTSNYMNRSNSAQIIYYRTEKIGDFYVPIVNRRLYPSEQSLNFVTAMNNAERMATFDAHQLRKHGVRVVIRRGKSNV